MRRQIQIYRIAYQVGISGNKTWQLLHVSGPIIVRYFGYFRSNGTKIISLNAHRILLPILEEQLAKLRERSLETKFERLLSLWFRARTGDQAAYEELYQLFKRQVASTLMRHYRLPRLDQEDTLSVLHQGFFEALRDYRPGFGKNFLEFMFDVCRKEIIAAVRESWREKRIAQNSALSLSQPPKHDSDEELVNFIMSTAYQREEIRDLALGELRETLLDFAKTRLGQTRIERELVCSMLEHPEFTYGQHAKRLSFILGQPVSDKGVDNALQRIRKKGQNDPKLCELASHFAIV